VSQLIIFEHFLEGHDKSCRSKKYTDNYNEEIGEPGCCSNSSFELVVINPDWKNKANKGKDTGAKEIEEKVETVG